VTIALGHHGSTREHDPQPLRELDEHVRLPFTDARRSCALLLWWQERPTISSAYLLSLPTVGERALRQRERHYAAFRTVFADLGRRARAEQPELRPLSDLVPRVLVVAVTEIVAEEVRGGRTSKLTNLSDEIALLAIRLLADDATAERTRVDGSYS
jgi:hypothetical protein